MTPPTFSVVIPTYNRPQLLTEALTSVLHQSRQDFECIVVDDASPSPPVIPDDPRIRLVRRDENGGPAACRNTGMRHVTGRWVTFMDDDDLFTQDRLERSVEGLQQAPIAICWSRFVDGEVRRKRMLRGNVHHVIMEDGVPHLGATTVRAECVLPFDEEYDALQDAEWWLRMSRDIPVWTVEHFGYLIRKHPGVRHRNDNPARVSSNVLLLRKHAAYFASHPKAAAIQWARIAMRARRLGDYRLARRALVRSFLIRPGLRTLGRLLRSLRRSTRRVELRSRGEGG
jgi:glycosyltransferase involved in cell wall biosynthesis